MHEVAAQALGTLAELGLSAGERTDDAADAAGRGRCAGRREERDAKNGEREGQSLHDAMNDGELEGMQTFDHVLEKMVRENVISKATAIGYATNAGNLNLSLADYEEPEPAS